MDILSFATILLSGFAGLAAHWYNRYAQGRTNNSFKDYLMADMRHTVSSVLSILATEIVTFSAAPVELTMSAIFTAFTYGYTLDSIMNREGQKNTTTANPSPVPIPVEEKPVQRSQTRKKSLQEIIDETREN